MKILFVQNRFYPAVGGAERHTYLLSKYLAKKGLEITVYTTTSLSKDDVFSIALSPPFFVKPKIKANLPKEEFIEGFTVKRFNIRLRFWSFNWIPEMFKELKTNIHEFDIIHAHGYHISTSLVGCYYAKKCNKPFILTAHDLIIPDNLPSDAKLFKKMYDRTFGRYLLKNSTRLIALTDDHVSQYSERGGDVSKIRIIPNGIEIEKYLNNGISQELIEKYNLDNTDNILLFVGRIEKYKGVQDVIEILPKILEKFPDLKFVVVGRDYGFKNELNRLVRKLNIEDSVIFTGCIPEDELIELYKIADLFVLPSRMEGFGIVLLEAMASNTLCIAYSIPAVRKVIKNKENGILVNDKYELLENILYYLENREEKEKIEKNALEYVRNYDIPDIVKLLENVYEEVV